MTRRPAWTGLGRGIFLVKINLPMAMPIVVVYFIVGFIGNWNDYSTMLVYMESYPTLSSGLYLFEASRTYAGPPVYFAAIFYFGDTGRYAFPHLQ